MCLHRQISPTQKVPSGREKEEREKESEEAARALPHSRLAMFALAAYTARHSVLPAATCARSLRRFQYATNFARGRLLWCSDARSQHRPLPISSRARVNIASKKEPTNKSTRAFHMLACACVRACLPACQCVCVRECACIYF